MPVRRQPARTPSHGHPGAVPDLIASGRIEDPGTPASTDFALGVGAGERRYRLLATAAAALDESLDLEPRLQAFIEVLVPSLADWAVVDLLDDAATTRRVAVAARPELHEQVSLLRDYPSDPNGTGPGGRALQAGRPFLLAEVDDAYVSHVARSPTHAAVLSGLRARTVMAVPLVGRQRTLGVMILARGPNGPLFGDHDLELAADLGRRAALSVEIAELYLQVHRARQRAERAGARTAQLQSLTSLLVGATSQDEVAGFLRDHALAALGSGEVALMVRRAGELDGLMALLEPTTTTIEAWLRHSASTGEARWIDDLTEDGTPAPSRSACFVPFAVDGRVLGAMGLLFSPRRTFGGDDIAFISAHADLCAGALDRIALTGSRERLVEHLQEERSRLEIVLQRIGAGVIIAQADPTEVMLTNDAARHIWRGNVARMTEPGAAERYVAFDATGRRLEPTDWPLERSMATGRVVDPEEIEFTRLDGTRGWMLASAAPIVDRAGTVTAGVVTFTDITDQRADRENQRFLVEAGQILGGSLDYETAIRRLAERAVPAIADWCAVDLLDGDGSRRTLAAAHVDPTQAHLVEALTGEYPAGHGVVPDIHLATTPAQVHDARHAELVRDLRVRSILAVPLRIGDRELGTLTLGSSVSERQFRPHDLVFANDLAARVSAAIQNSRLYREADRFRMIIDSVVEAIIVFDPETRRIGEVNRGAEELLGRSRADLLEQTIDELLRPDDAERLLHVVGQLRAGPQDATTIMLEYPGPADRSVAVEVVVQSVALPEGGRGIVAIARDIRERIDTQIRLQRLAEAEHARAAELNAVIRAIGEAVVVCGADGTITLTNPAAEMLFPAVEGATYADILGQLHDPDGLAPRLGPAGGTIELTTKANPDRWVEITTYPVGDEAVTGTTVETIVVMRDVTQARSRELVRETFIGVLSHELRTPLTIIFGGAKLLARPDSTLDEETRRGIFRDIYDEAERLQRLVEDVVALNRFAEGTGEVSWEPVLIQRVVPRVVSSEEARWPEATFQLEVEVALPTVRADPTFVEQVLRNFLSNAAKYGGVGSVVRVTAQAGDGEVLVRVLDDGPGFPAQETERLFELFYRSPGTATMAPGAGIGLFVCARLIAAMGGRIWAKSRPEGGAEFGFALAELTEAEE